MSGRRKERGFTLLEVVLAISLAVVVMGSAIAFYHTAINVRAGLADQADALSQMRLTMDLIARELASAAPAGALGVGLSGDNQQFSLVTASLAGPVAWAAYVVVLQRTGPRYAGRVGTGGYDPEDAEGIAMERERIRESGLPESPSAEEMRPLLEAVKGWQAAEPGNAAPAALEMEWLYALHRDEEALARWKHAASLRGADIHWLEVAQATARLLSRMGMRETDAISRSWGGGGSFEVLSHLRQCARPAKYAGRVAQIEGREKDAIAWWNSTVEVGQHMQESANTMVELLVGTAVTAIGGSPAWGWVHDGASGIPGGPLLGGRLFYSPQHEFYVSQVGEKADAELRDLLVAGKVRSKLMREASEKGIFWGSRGRSLRVMQLGAGALALLVLALATFLAVGTWRRRAADEATDMRWGCRAGVTGLTVVLAAAGLAVASAVSPPPVFTRLGFAAAGAGLGAAWLAAVLLPLVAARRSRRPGARLRTAWRGNLRETLPLVIAVCGVLTLGLGVAGRMLERRWVQEWFREPPGAEMARMVKAFGPALTDPKAPPDAWRAEHPPEVGTERGRGGGTTRGRGRG